MDKQDTNQNALKQIMHLFAEDEYVWVGDLYNEDYAGNFFCINPVKGPATNAANATRKITDVTNMRNFLFEFDTASLQEQELAIQKLKQANVPIASIVHSGSKSYHLIMSLSVPLTLSYESCWTALSFHIKAITGLIADPACKNANRLSRLGGRIRPETAAIQTLIELGPYIDNEYLYSLIQKYDIAESKRPAVIKNVNPNMTLSEFKLELIRRPKLLNELMSAPVWAQPANMYPKFYRLTTWAIDAIGVPKSVFKEYCQEKVFPALLAVGYPKEKLDKGIESAYTSKCGGSSGSN